MAHASTKALLFLAAGAWLTALGTEELTALRGAGRRWRVVGVTATVGALALAGIAPLSLWATKDAVLAGALEVSGLLYAAGLVAAALSAAGFTVDYLEARDAETLEPIASADKPVRLLAAARLGRTRLIDNIAV